MPYFQDKTRFAYSRDTVFKEVLKPGAPASRSGIYACLGCDYEIAIQEGDSLPSQHLDCKEIAWQLAAMAKHKV
jgi:hypothetical protein